MQRFGSLEFKNGQFIFKPDGSDQDIRSLIKYTSSKNYVTVTLDDNRLITSKQRAKIFAMIGEISKFYGYVGKSQTEKLRHEMMARKNIKTLSFCSQSQAAKLINYLIDFIIVNHVGTQRPLYEFASEDIEHYCYKCLVTRTCEVCGKRADIDHYDAVGSGRDRTKIDNTDNRFLALCREHHNLAHDMGHDTFIRKYCLVPIKLSHEDLKKLGLSYKGDDFESKKD